SADGNYLAVQFIEQNVSPREQKLQVYLLNAENKDQFVQDDQLLITKRFDVTTSFVDWKEAFWTADQSLFYYIPYWSEKLSVASEDHSNDTNIRPDERRSALDQYNPVAQRQSVLLENLLSQPDNSIYRNTRARLIRYAEGDKSTWEWVGPDPRERKVLRS